MDYDVVVIGNGIVGASAACALAKNSLRIAIIDQKEPKPYSNKHYDTRVSAITHNSSDFFKKINVWDTISKKRVCPFTAMTVWDSTGNGKIHFQSHDIGLKALGHIIENSVILSSLQERIKTFKNIETLFPLELTTIKTAKTGITLVTKDNQTITTNLLIGADGANSWTRKQLHVEMNTYDYEHTAIVANVKTEKPHKKTAWQIFRPEGPLAFLPLDDKNTSSIVWSTTPEHAKKLLELNKKQFELECARSIENRLGEIECLSALSSFPLHMRHVKNYIKPRCALIGDAAHTIHPLAGQGVNLGLTDVMNLEKIISNAIDQSREYYSFHTLRKYERASKGYNLSFIVLMEGFKRLFSAKSLPIVLLRNWGLSLTNRMSVVKNMVMRCMSS